MLKGFQKFTTVLKYLTRSLQAKIKPGAVNIWGYMTVVSRGNGRQLSSSGLYTFDAGFFARDNIGEERHLLSDHKATVGQILWTILSRHWMSLLRVSSSNMIQNKS